MMEHAITVSGSDAHLLLRLLKTVASQYGLACPWNPPLHDSELDRRTGRMIERLLTGSDPAWPIREPIQ